MSQNDYAASIFTTIVLGTVLVPGLYCCFKNFRTQSKISLFFSVLILSILSLGLAWSISVLLSAEQPKQPFDPYEILSVSPTATDKEIRQTFRELSKKYHPDKNPDFQEYYILITKAYETLTDPNAKANYERYGNPDGPSGFKISFGLPSFLFKQENQLIVLLIFLVIVVIVPCGIVIYFKGGSELDKNGVNQDNLPIYLSLLHDSLNVKQLLYMISLSAEFRSLKISRNQEIELNGLKEYMFYLQSGKQTSPQMVKVIFLILAHLEGVELSAELKKDQVKIIESTLKIISTITESAFVLGMIPKGKKISLVTFKLILDLAKRISHSVMLQEPCLAMVKGLSNYKALSKFESISEVKQLIANNKFSPKILNEELEKIKTEVKKFPLFTIEASIFVQGETDIRLGDLASIKLQINRTVEVIQKENNLGFDKKERIWVFFGDGKKIIIVKVFDCQEVIENSEIQILLDKKQGFSTGKNSLVVTAISDSYLGVDAETKIDFVLGNPLKNQ